MCVSLLLLYSFLLGFCNGGCSINLTTTTAAVIDRIIIIMSFHFVLPSNTSPETYPNNTASSYSTPLDKPLMLPGDWEVGALSVTHSNCINTFNNDVITIWDKNKKLSQTRHLTKLPIPPIDPKLPEPVFKNQPQYLENLIGRLNTFLKGIISFQLHNKATTISYTMQSKKFYLYLNPRLQRAFGLPNCLSHDDIVKTGKIGMRPKMFREVEAHMVLIPVDAAREIITLTKEPGQEWSHKVLGETIQRQIAQSRCPKARWNAETGKIDTGPPPDDPEPQNWPPVAVVLDAELQRVLDEYNDGIIIPTSHYKRLKFAFYPLTDAVDYVKEPMTHRITLEPRRFLTSQHLCDYVNKRLGYNNDTVTLSQTNDVAQLTLIGPDIRLTLSKDVQDILAFNQQTFTSPCSVTASGSISLTRRIDFFYVYSNIGEFVHIGDTEAPLLCVFPYNATKCGIITEHNFKLPSYVNVKGNQLSQIDIAIYDGAGKPVPFAYNARTIVHLHFRQRRHA